MNTNRVYIAEIYRINSVRPYYKSSSLLSLCLSVNAMFCRKTIVYEKKNGDFKDLLTDKKLKCDYSFSEAKEGFEYICAESLEPISIDSNYISKNKVKTLVNKRIIRL